MKIFLVIGESGEYGDDSLRLICAYKNEDKAKEHVTLARIEKCNLKRTSLFEKYNKYDPDAPINSLVGNIEYDIVEIDLLDELISES